MTPYDVLYSPCSHFSCPAGYDCQGDSADASFYVCEKPGTSDRPLCLAYGLGDYNVTLDFLMNDMWLGVDARYYAHNTRRATVLYRCNDTLPENTLLFDDWLAIEGNHSNIYAFAKDAHPQGFGRRRPPTRGSSPSASRAS
jgi:hypothetical protein